MMRMKKRRKMKTRMKKDFKQIKVISIQKIVKQNIYQKQKARMLINIKMPKFITKINSKYTYRINLK